MVVYNTCSYIPVEYCVLIEGNLQCRSKPLFGYIASHTVHGGEISIAILVRVESQDHHLKFMILATQSSVQLLEKSK